MDESESSPSFLSLNRPPNAPPTSAGLPCAAPSTASAPEFTALPIPPVAPAVAAWTTPAVTCTAALIAFGPTWPPRSCMSAATFVPMKLTAGMMSFGLKHAMMIVVMPISAGKNDSA